MTGFDTVIVVDWSARSMPGPRDPAPDSIWIGVAGKGPTEAHYMRTRAEATSWLVARLEAEAKAGRRVLAGFDFPFGYPRGFGAGIIGREEPLELWDALADVEDGDDNSNNRWAFAAALNRRFPGVGPFWGRPAHLDEPGLPTHGNERRDHGMPERRQVEARLPGASTVWQLLGAGSVGSQSLLGISRLAALRRHFGEALSVSPFEAPDTRIVLAEVYPSLIADTIAAAREPDEILDRAQVRVLAEALAGLAPPELDVMLREGDPVEGWILGVGHEDRLAAALVAPLAPPPLSNDCFALPRGVDWVPVDKALEHLRTNITPVTEVELIPVRRSSGRVLAGDVIAGLSNPPLPNSAVDGYGFAHDGGTDSARTLPLVAGRAAAGAPFNGTVPEGHAVRVLTGAVVPKGVDTVVLEEDTATDGTSVAFRGPIKRGANTRKAGEDFAAGDAILRSGRILTPADLSLLSAAGVVEVPIRRRLRVAVLSTGDELTEAAPINGQIVDANRPMLTALLERWGYDVVDLGIAPDHRAEIATRLSNGAEMADAILTSGGASAGDEDHVSALLTEAGSFALWRMALKPGRPLALGLWDKTPVFGLPGNPVAAFVCALIFARPSLGQLAGAGWTSPQGFDVPAAFSKAKKPGRREFLRARLRDGRAEVFASEGSGRISGLSWADGLVELPDGAMDVHPGTPVRFLPFGSFGL